MNQINQNENPTKSRRIIASKLLTHRTNRIIGEVTGTNDITVDTMHHFNNDLDIKYELFCKWLEKNKADLQISCDGSNCSNVADGGPPLTEDEVSSFATNSGDDDDDSSNDVFLDTESEQPMILVDGMDAMAARMHTPSQLSASDFDYSSSDVTVNSNGQIKAKPINRRPKHKKGRAPPIPTSSTATENETNHVHLAHETDI